MPAIIPYTPEQRAVRYAPYVIGADVLRRTVETAVRSKRRLSFSDGGGPSKMPVGRMGQFAAGATNVVQRGYKKLRSGRKPKKNARLALKFIKASQAESIVRYQRIGNYEQFPSVATIVDGPGSLPIGHFPLVLGGVGNQETFDLMPVHLFDLTSMRYIDSDGTTLETPCQFQLCKFTSATGTVPNGPIGAYYWKSWNGQIYNGTSTGVNGHWAVERNAFNNTGDFTPVAGGHQYLEWADIRLALFGARAQTTKFTVSLVQFNDRSYDPLVERNQTTPVANMRSPEEQQNYDAAWDEFVQPLIYHPMHSAGASKLQLFKTLFKRSYVIGPDTETNLDQAQPNMCMKLFKRLNRMLNYNWDDRAQARTGEQLDNAVYNIFSATQNKATVHPRAKVFLMVTAQAYTRLTGTNSINSSNTPTFDIVIRKKHVYDKA